MKNKSNKYDHFIKILIILIVLIRGSFTYGQTSFRLYLMLVLLFGLLCHIRLNFSPKSIFFTASLAADIGLVLYMQQHLGGISYFLIYVTLIDSLIFFKGESYFMTGIIMGVLAYFLRKMNQDLILLNIAVFCLTFTFAKQIKKLNHSLEHIEYLYDTSRNYSYELEEAKKRVEDFTKTVEELTQLEERNRIAREIHDSVGHKLAGVLLQLEAYIRLGQNGMNPGEELLNQVRDNLRQSTELLRKTVKGLNTKESINHILSIQKMISNFKKVTGVDIDFNVHGNQFKLYPAVETAIYKNIREGLTNSVRHGKADRISIRLSYFMDKIELQVSDNGCGCSKITKGMGITGMEERTSLLGGRLEIHSCNGFTVKMIIPIIQEKVV